MSSSTAAAMFQADHARSERIVKARKNMRGNPAGKVIMHGSLVAYLCKPNDFSRGTPSATVPAPQTRPKRDGSGASYPVAIPMTVRLTKFLPEPNVCVATEDGRGWKVLGQLSPVGEAQDFLVKHAKLAWAQPLATDAMSVRIREHISADGIMATSKWYYPTVGEVIDTKVPDSEKGLNVFRQPNPQNPSASLVQPATPLIFVGVTLKIYVSVREVWVEDDGTAVSPYTMPVVSAGAAGGTLAPLPKAAVAPPAPPAQKPGDKPLRLETRLFDSVKYESTAAYVDTTYDQSKAQSEQKHETERKDVHQLVPIEDMRLGRRAPASNVYFYVSPSYVSAEGCETGVAVLRITGGPNDPLRGFKGDFGGVSKAISDISLAIYQWRDKPNNDEKYIVDFVGTKLSPEFWRNYGIPFFEPYVLIMSANTNVPIHVHGKIWEKRTLELSSNAPGELGPTPANIEAGVANVRGYYTYIMEEFVPDLQRHFRSGRALRLSPARVEREFKTFIRTDDDKNQDCVLTALDGTPQQVNPVNAALGIESPVLSLGNGMLHPEPKKFKGGLYVAFTGVDILPLIRGGTHEFYVLTSHGLSQEEQTQWCSMLNREKYADEFLDALIKNEKVMYNIFSVAKNAKVAHQLKREEAKGIREEPDVEESIKKGRVEKQDEEEAPVEKQEGDEASAEAEPAQDLMDFVE